MGGQETNPTAVLLKSHLADPECGFSIGGLGAIAELLRDRHEPLEPCVRPGLALVTPRGGISLTPAAGTAIRAIESLGKRALSWQQEVTLSLPNAQARMNSRNRLSELGRDQEALREQDRDAILFDLGVGAESLDFCIRTQDPGLIAQLRAALGRPLFAPGNPAIQAIKLASPHRVAISRLGRIEVFQPIAQQETPEGPHTHLLPHLLARDAYAPGASLYPAHPLHDQLGRDRPFDRRRHESFQRLLLAWGDQEHLREKVRVREALDARFRPADYVPPKSEKGWTALRIALRQHHWVARGDDLLGDWLEAFDN